MFDVTNYVLLLSPWVNQGPGVYLGFGPRFTVPDKTANIILSALSVWITLWSPGYWALILLLAERFSPTHLYDLLRETNTAEDCAFKTSYSLFSSRLRWKGRAGVLFVAICIFLGLTVGAISSAYLGLDSSCTAKHSGCGFWYQDPTIRDSDRDPDIVPYGNIVVPAETWYGDCYESDTAEQSCPVFTESDLPDVVTVNAPCPFQNATMCLLGPNSAIRFDSTAKPGTEMGINVPLGKVPWFRSYLSCAPIVLEGFYEAQNATSSITTIRFFYGPQPNDFSTYNQTRSLLFEATFSPTGIELKVQSQRLAQFDPISGLQGRKLHEYAVLAFINIFNIQYPDQNPDAIFGASTPVPCSTNSNTTCYRSTNLPARVLGCVESAVLCPPGALDDTKCLDVFAYTNITTLFTVVRSWAADESTHLGASLLLAQGLFYSDLGNTVLTRHGLLLEATKAIEGHHRSRPLDPQQWQVESKRLFEIGLLRVKMEMLAVVTGMRAHWDGYVDIAQSGNANIDMAKEVCTIYRFIGQGVTNISLLGLIVAIFGPMIVGGWVKGKPVMFWIWRALNFGLQLLKQCVRCMKKRRTRNIMRRGSRVERNIEPDLEMGAE